MNKKFIAINLLLSAVVSLAVSCSVSYYFNKDSTSGETSNLTAEVTDEETGEVKTYFTGGTATINTSSGESIDVKIADNQYLISEDYLEILAKGFGSDAKIVADNLVITGDKPSVTQSTDSVNAATFSDIFNIYCQIYGEDFRSNGVEAIWSPAYTLMVTGELPEQLPDDYSAKPYGVLEHNGITWKFYEVAYSTDETIRTDISGNALPEDQIIPNVLHTQFLVAYSDTEDPVEIMCYQKDNNTDVQYAMICDFLQIGE